MLIIVSINLTILRISIKRLVIFTTFKPYIRRYLQILNKKNKLRCHNKKKKPTLLGLIVMGRVGCIVLTPQLASFEC